MSAVDRMFDVVLVGGGLQNGLIALALRARQPHLRVALVEAQSVLGGNHIWCAHRRDLPTDAFPWIDALLAHVWPSYDVVFPSFRRTLGAAYVAIPSARLASVVGAAMGEACFLGRQAMRMSGGLVELDNGVRLQATVVVDGRGPTHDAIRCGYQKFVGVELDLGQDHGVVRPILMDATLPQQGGFRFMYVLPLGPRRLLAEETRFSTTPDLDEELMRASALAYVSRWGPVVRVVREEKGVLPMPWATVDSPPRASPLLGGYRGGWFHPSTGYSLPFAARLACHVAEREPEGLFGPPLTRLYNTHRRQSRFAHGLNRLLFMGFEPSSMRSVFERFYQLPEPIIERFYGLSLTWLDACRIVVGRPPKGFSLLHVLFGSPKTAP